MTRRPGAGNWQAAAACRGADLSLFFPARSASSKKAREICQGCPVRAECLDAALEEERHFGALQIHGIRGGLTAPQRRDLRRQQQLQRRQASAYAS